MLIYNSEFGYWYCETCGAVYRMPATWHPPCNYCMRCHAVWENVNEDGMLASLTKDKE